MLNRMNILATQHGQRVMVRENCPEFEDARTIIRALGVPGVTEAWVQQGTRAVVEPVRTTQQEREAMAELVGSLGVRADG